VLLHSRLPRPARDRPRSRPHGCLINRQATEMECCMLHSAAARHRNARESHPITTARTVRWSPWWRWEVDGWTTHAG